MIRTMIKMTILKEAFSKGGHRLEWRIAGCISAMLTTHILAEPSISNVIAEQIPGRHAVKLVYDLEDSENGLHAISVLWSGDNGQNYAEVPVAALEGAASNEGNYGAGVSAGSGKNLEVDVSEIPQLSAVFSRQVRFKVQVGEGNPGGFAPSEAEFASFFVGRTIPGNYEILDASRFQWENELGNWTYSKTDENSGVVIFVYDGYPASSYREELELEFTGEWQGDYVYREFVGGVETVAARQTGTFDFFVPEGFVEIQGGSFQMGDPFDEGDPDELPVHEVVVSNFYIQSAEVTNAQMAEVMNWAKSQGLVTATASTVQIVNGWSDELIDLNDSGSRISLIGSQLVVDSGFEDHPCMEVSWYGAVAYCNFLTQMDGGNLTRCYNLEDYSCNFAASGYRLPTEAEWEKAASSAAAAVGTTWRYPFGDSIDGTMANYSDNLGETQPVGSFADTEGLYDMAGNVWEWCYDGYHSDFYSTSPTSDPVKDLAGYGRVIRGGGWSNRGDSCRVANREHAHMSATGSIGFRTVRR